MWSIPGLTFKAIILVFLRMLRVWVDGFVRSVEIIRGDLSHTVSNNETGEKMGGEMTYLTAAQNAKWVCCSAAVKPEFPTSNISKSVKRLRYTLCKRSHLPYHSKRQDPQIG